MHVEGCLWKHLEGWMCGSLRPGDLSSAVEIYKYLRSDGEETQYPCTTKQACAHNTERMHLCSHTQKHADNKNCKYIQKTPTHKATETLCSEAISILRPHALRQFIRGDRIQSLQID